MVGWINVNPIYVKSGNLYETVCSYIYAEEDNEQKTENGFPCL